MSLFGRKTSDFSKPSTQMKCLIIDDDVNVRNVVSARLASTDNYEVFQASDGDEGIEKALDVLPDFILLDWMMPKMSGLEALKEIRTHRVFKDTPIFMLTGRGKMDDMEVALAAGATGYFTKPISLKELSKRLRLAMDKI